MIDLPSWQKTATCDFDLPSRHVDVWRIGLEREGTRMALRRARDRLLRRYLDLDADVRLAVTRTSRGRPHLDMPGLRTDFNLSHTRGMALLAFASHGAVGIDVEQIRSVSDPMRIAARVWSQELVANLGKLPDSQRMRAFFVAWTRFEACQKANGLGVFDAAVDPASLAVRSFTPAPGFVACLAVSGFEPISLRFFDYLSS